MQLLKKIFKLFLREKIVIQNIDYREKDFFHNDANNKSLFEIAKTPSRTDVLNFLLNTFKTDTKYLEIGVRNPEDNFNSIHAKVKYSVDPGIEFIENPVDFKYTSDVFFEKLNNGEILDKEIKFDIIFIDGLHLAEQVDRDIKNALDFIIDEGFIVLHDCNPPTEFHASETYSYSLSPSKGYWNGTTWKAFFNYRKRQDIYSCCIDTDWGVGIISKKIKLGEPSKISNEYYEFNVFEKNRKESLNLISFEDFKQIIYQKE